MIINSQTESWATSNIVLKFTVGRESPVLAAIVMLLKPGVSDVSFSLAGALFSAPASKGNVRVCWEELQNTVRPRVDAGPDGLYNPASKSYNTYGTANMANHASAKKRIRQTERRSTINRNRLSRVRTFIKKVELAIDAGDADVAREVLKEAQPVIMRSAQLGVLHRNTASRKVSRLAARVKAL